MLHWSHLILTFGLAMTDFASLVPSQPGRFNGIQRSYTPADVERLRGSLAIEHTLARRGAERLWELLNTADYVHALGHLSVHQPMQMPGPGLEATNPSGRQVA